MGNKKISAIESKLFSSLANPKRLEILQILQHAPASVGEIMEMTGISQSNVSQHLAVMRRLKFVSSEKIAQTRRYSLASPQVKKICSAMRKLLLEQYGVRGEAEFTALPLQTDPICGMEILPHEAAVSLVSSHHRYYFCGHGCADKFLTSKRDNNKGEVISCPPSPKVCR